ncbi:XRE family transcriptional regulator [Corynebacterium sp.]|uniref:XRE family transcriptional regulator n=1 Tax=Corynebacterium sp. TaxID=1720 RepID=UPI0028A962D3|nr:XRE family transcriptional regulator [Corynebacterium sp.]
MKRFAAATLAVATALSLSTGAAGAKGLDSSSNADREIAVEITKWHLQNPGSWTATKEPSSSVNAALEANEKIKENSSEETSESVRESSWGIAKSSLESDVENNNPFGTQIDLYLAFAGVVALGVIIYNVAVQAGVPLPHIAPE